MIKLHPWPNVEFKGIKNGRAKLSDKDIIEIRKTFNKYNVKELSIKYGISKNQIRLIAQHKAWKHIK